MNREQRRADARAKHGSDKMAENWHPIGPKNEIVGRANLAYFPADRRMINAPKFIRPLQLYTSDR